jgi:FkbM family methyltransferase
MSATQTIKAICQNLGVYPLARAVYRKLNPNIARDLGRQTAFYRKFLRPGDLCFDIGANVGQTSEVMLAAGARVVAVEPNPACYEVLRWQFGRNQRFTLIARAISDRESTARLYVNGTDARASLRSDWKFLPGKGEVEVTTTTLHALIAGYGRPVYCKIDVEGYEVPVLKGLSQPLPNVSFEYHISEGDRACECLRILAALGPIQANVIPLDLGRWGGEWALPEWLTPEECIEQISRGTLLGGARLADIFVRSEG